MFQKTRTQAVQEMATKTLPITIRFQNHIEIKITGLHIVHNDNSKHIIDGHHMTIYGSSKHNAQEYNSLGIKITDSIYI